MKVSLTKPGHSVPADLSLMNGKDIRNTDCIREYTPEHIREEYVSQIEVKENNQSLIDDSAVRREDVEQADNDLLPAIKDNDKPQGRTLCGLNMWEWAEIIIKSVLIMSVLAFLVFFFSSFLGEGLTLARDLAT